MINSDTYRQIPRLIYRQSDQGAHLTFHGSAEYGEEQLRVAANLQRSETIALASALLSNGQFHTGSGNVALTTDHAPGFEHQLLQLAAGNNEISISPQVAQVWGQMLWLINDLPDRHLNLGTPVSVKMRGKQLVIQGGDLEWLCSPLHALMLSEALDQQEHEELILNSPDSWLMVCGDFSGVHLLTTRAHLWLTPQQASELKGSLLVMLNRKGVLNRPSATRAESGASEQGERAVDRNTPTELRRR